MCRDCYEHIRAIFQCNSCNGVWHEVPEHVATHDGHRVCSDCAETKVHKCMECDKRFLNSPGKLCYDCAPKRFETKPWQVLSPRARNIILKMPHLPDSMFQEMFTPHTHFPENVEWEQLIREVEYYETPPALTQADHTGQVGRGVGRLQQDYMDLYGYQDRTRTQEEARAAQQRLMVRYSPTIDAAELDYTPGNVIAITEPEPEEANE